MKFIILSQRSLGIRPDGVYVRQGSSSVPVSAERHNAKPQALLEHDEPPDAAVSVIRKEPAHFRVDVPRERGNFAADLVRLFLVVHDREPRFPAVGGPGFQNPVKLLGERFGQLFTAVLDDEVDAAEVVGRFDDVVHVDGFVFQHANRVGFKDVHVWPTVRRMPSMLLEL